MRIEKNLNIEILQGSVTTELKWNGRI